MIHTPFYIYFAGHDVAPRPDWEYLITLQCGNASTGTVSGAVDVILPSGVSLLTGPNFSEYYANPLTLSGYTATLYPFPNTPNGLLAGEGSMMNDFTFSFFTYRPSYESGMNTYIWITSVNPFTWPDNTALFELTEITTNLTRVWIFANSNGIGGTNLQLVSPTYTTDTWAHVAYVGSNGYIAIYVDGVLSVKTSSPLLTWPNMNSEYVDKM